MESKSYYFNGAVSGLLKLFKNEPYVFLLESSLRDSPRGRFSFIGFDPFEVFKSRSGDRLKELSNRFSHYGAVKPTKTTPFPCGIFGFLSYDFGLHFENIERLPKNVKSGIPECIFGFYDCVITIDHLTRQLHIFSSGLPEKDPRAQKKRAQKRLEQVTQIVKHYLTSHPEERSSEGSRSFANAQDDKNLLRNNLTKQQYYKMVYKALDYIRRGDIYQVNLSQRFSLDTKALNGAINLFQIYQLLRDLSPAHFGGYFDCRDFQIISSSPERFLSLRGRNVETRPMKGTRPRGNKPAEDNILRKELAQSPKDRAELLMITDLERNDLGRVCDYGSVRVSRMRTLEKYQTVFQATSTIEGKLRKDKNQFDLLRACFPGGSITGCPKIRAMEIIEELEPYQRGIYTGSMGYISFSGAMDFNILIRTLLVERQSVSFHVGGGIVADSSPPKEYEETLVKAKAMQECLKKLAAPKPSLFLDGKFVAADEKLLKQLTPGIIKAKGVFETLRVDEGVAVLLQRHLARLESGLKKFRIPLPYSRPALRRYLKETLRRNGLKNARVRLMVWQEGKCVHAAIVALPYQPFSLEKYRKGFRAVFSDLRCDERSHFANIKSIHYQPFYCAYQTAQAKGYDEAILLNRKGDILEASRSNIFIVKDGILLTPGLKSGCLDGITRWAVIKRARKAGISVREADLKPSDLLAAKEAFLTNSLWKIMPLTWLNHRPIGDGKPGRMTTGLIKSK